jgi:serine/threonine protein kinase
LDDRAGDSQTGEQLLESIESEPAGAQRQATSRYEFIEHVGSGGVADVYRARDNQLGRQLAIKLFRTEASSPFDELRREREIQMLGTLHHPGLVQIYDAGVFDDRGMPRRFIAMEFVEGRALAARIHDHSLTHRQIADIGAQVADALAYVHAREIVHRDVKPDNILITDDPAFGYTMTAKLADFGIAQFIEGTRFTNHDSVLGTASYISPEQAGGVDIGTSSDIYSLGLVLLECITGVREFRGTPIESALARLSRSPGIPDDLPAEWSELLAAMTATDAEARPSAHEVAATMRDIIRASITESRAAHTTPSRRSRRAERREAGEAHSATRTMILVAATASAALGLGIGLLLGMHVFG